MSVASIGARSGTAPISRRPPASGPPASITRRSGRLPLGWIGAVLTGIIGGFIGAWLFKVLGIHDPGFSLFGVDLIPAFVGAVVVAFAAQLFTTRRPVV